MRSYNRRDFFLAHDSLRFNKGLYMWQSPSTFSIIANQTYSLPQANLKITQFIPDYFFRKSDMSGSKHKFRTYESLSNLDSTE